MRGAKLTFEAAKVEPILWAFSRLVRGPMRADDRGLAKLGTWCGQGGLLVLALLWSTLGCVTPTPLGTYEFEVFDARAVTSPMPAAPPPMQGDHVVDVALRELGATRTSGSEVASHPETGMQPLRTDGALTARVARFFALRGLGSLGYGSPISPVGPVRFPNRATVGVGLGAVFGYWGDPDWSIALEIDTNLVALDNRDRYATVVGPCYSVPSLFGGDSISCTPSRPTGATPSYLGMEIVPALGATLDVAGYPVRWLRIGGGASVQEYVSRDSSGAVHHQPVGLARLFAEFHFEDVYVGIEAQQWVIENVNFAPALAISVGGVLFEREAVVEEEAP